VRTGLIAGSAKLRGDWHPWSDINVQVFELMASYRPFLPEEIEIPTTLTNLPKLICRTVPFPNARGRGDAGWYGAALPAAMSAGDRAVDAATCSAAEGYFVYMAASGTENQDVQSRSDDWKKAFIRRRIETFVSCLKDSSRGSLGSNFREVWTAMNPPNAPATFKADLVARLRTCYSSDRLLPRGNEPVNMEIPRAAGGDTQVFNGDWAAYTTTVFAAAGKADAWVDRWIANPTAAARRRLLVNMMFPKCWATSLA